jgi:hypothetical protein
VALVQHFVTMAFPEDRQFQSRLNFGLARVEVSGILMWVLVVLARLKTGGKSIS